MDRKEKIVAAATWLFGYYGFEKTTIDDIASRAGISKGSVYLEFTSKDAVLLAVVQAFTNKEINRINALIKHAQRPYLNVLRELLTGHVLAYYEIATGQLHSPEVIVSANAAVAIELLRFRDQIFTAMANLLKNAAIEGEIAKYHDYLYLAELIVDLLAALFPPYQKLKSGQARDFTIDVLKMFTNDMIEIVIKGIST